MEDARFELFSDTIYTLIPLLKKHFLPVPEQGECGTLTGSHFHLLFALNKCSTLTMTEAARTVGFSKPHMTLQVDRLVEEGLVGRSADPDDRRLITIHLTERGNTFVLHIKEAMKEKAWRMFSALSDKTLEKTLEALLTLKEVMMNADAEHKAPEK